MDMYSANPVVYSSMDAEELQNISGDDIDIGADSDVDTVDDITKPFDPYAKLRTRIQKWAETQPKSNEDLINRFLATLVVTERSDEDRSSERVFKLRFKFAGREGRYVQHSHADVVSAVWDGATMARLPNVLASLVFDGEEVAGCRCFCTDLLGKPALRLETDAPAQEPLKDKHLQTRAPSQRWADFTRLAELFGTDNVKKLGGPEILLQFLGSICADSAAPSTYAKVLPFGLAAEIISISGTTEADVAAPTAMPFVPSSRAAPSPAKPSIKATAAPPKASVAPTKVVAKPKGIASGGALKTK